MKVQYLFSRSPGIGSKAIRWASGFENLGLEKVPSHVAVLINDKWVVESTLGTGIHIVPYKVWLRNHEELIKISCRKTRTEEEVAQVIESLWDKKYDKLGILFFALSFFKHIFFKKQMPAENKWEDKNKYFCSEFAGMLIGENYSMKTPARMAKELLEWESGLDES